MLTRKQLWRRTNERKQHQKYSQPHPKPPIVVEDIDDIEQIPIKNNGRTISSSPTPSSPIVFRLKSALSSSNLLGMLQRQIRDERQMRFSSTVHVLLIPSRAELLASFEKIYWLHEDYSYFKREAVKEIKEAARVNNIPAKAAMTLLYQPDPAGEDGDNDTDEAEGMMYDDDEDQQSYDYYATSEYCNGNATVPFSGPPAITPVMGSMAYRFPHTKHPAPMTRSDSNSLLEQASPHSVTMASSTSFRDINFITNVKTDVELNAPKSPREAGRRSLRPRNPTRTTTTAPQKQHAWAVQWKKQDAT